MKYIDLNLKKYNDNDGEFFLLKNVLNQEGRIFVLLGSPGSGKTSLLKKLQKDERCVQYLKIKDFISSNIKLEKKNKILLLDGLDEYKSISNDKESVASKLAKRIQKLKGCKVVISCREMDWYGDHDSDALEAELNEDAFIYQICALNGKQQFELANILGIKDIEGFFEKFSTTDFLKNPQIFCMLSKIFIEKRDANITSKVELFKTFILCAMEHNPHYVLNGLNEIEFDALMKVAGYIASFYIFTQEDIFDHYLIKGIADSSLGFSIDAINGVLNTKLFSERSFIHRTIAEFLLAFFIVEYKLKDNELFSVSRLKGLFIVEGRIPTELRGTYAWICTLSESLDLIKIDPYYQVIHGDNSLLTPELKKEVVKAVKELSYINPYFENFRSRVRLKNFYNPELDKFLIDEIENAILVNSHYIYFLIRIIVSAGSISDKMDSYLKGIIYNRDLSGFYKREIILYYKNDNSFLISVLQRIKEGEIIDSDDYLKEGLLKILYPKYITPSDVSKYLFLYTKKVGGFCYFLYETKYEDKYTLIKKLYELSFDPTSEKKLTFPYNVEGFVNNYFVETILKYPQTLNASQIYTLIKEFKKYHREYDPIIFRTYRSDLKKMVEEKQDRIQDLSNELFDLYLDDILTGDDEIKFQYFFNLQQPSRTTEILLSKIDMSNSPDRNKNLFYEALRSAVSNNTKLLHLFRKIAKKYNFVKELSQWENPEKTEWDIKHEEALKMEEEENQKIIDENETYFSGLSDDDILVSFDNLHYIAELFYFDEPYNMQYITEITLERLKNVLAKLVFKEPEHRDLLTVEALAKDSPDARRNIDLVYYTAIALNKNKSSLPMIPIQLRPYLYLNTIIHEQSSNVIKGLYVEYIESQKGFSSRDILLKYIGCLFKYHIPQLEKIFLSYLHNEKEPNKIKKLVCCFIAGKETIKGVLIREFLNSFHFSISIEHLKIIYELKIQNDEYKDCLDALLIIMGNKKDEFTVDMAVAIWSIFEKAFEFSFEDFKRIEFRVRIRIVDFMLSRFNTKESLKSYNGYQSPKMQCASFLEHSLLSYLDEKELQILKIEREGIKDVWTDEISARIFQLQQENSDEKYISYPVQKIKKYFKKDIIIKEEEFFEEVVARINSVIETIEANRDNDKDLFYEGVKSEERKPKDENNCRDILLQRLKDRYMKILDITKETSEANKRADLNIKYRNPEYDFEINVECKQENHRNVKKGISEQLIPLYLNSKVPNGIYLIFYFGKKNKQQLLEEVEKDIPEDKKNNIKVLLLDLSL